MTPPLPAPVSEADRKKAEQWRVEFCDHHRGRFRCECEECLASLLSSVRQEVREEDCRAVCVRCKGGDDPLAMPDGWYHKPSETWNWFQCAASPIRSLSLPEPPATTCACGFPGAGNERECHESYYGDSGLSPDGRDWCLCSCHQRAEPPKPEPTPDPELLEALRASLKRAR